MAKTKAEVIPLNEREISTGELAAIVGKSARWIRQLTSDGTLKQVARGKYILGDSIKTYVEYSSGGKENDGKPRLVDHKTEHERIKMEMAQLDLDEMRGNLHTTEDVQEAWGDLIVEFRKRLSALPTRLSSELSYLTDPKEIRLLMSEEITSALLNLSDYDPLNGGDRNDEGAEEADS
ncbi:hypothetical protein [Paenibacillus crassostreae]|uniref:Uncharacterized protein n=1 Tax=Paenibacillus crassostreae TaxID=1763538 RepID=A0A167C4Y2_9BACL|nr:hypothetical protein [Paenibacillus crassostreae]AOZ91640.1 hypothetical protein LPB68_05010 [Paenibacillus crassostreae]OAB72786.1 hypothetical protein PNBC_15240 [Paenibacillus crassostreae]